MNRAAAVACLTLACTTSTPDGPKPSYGVAGTQVAFDLDQDTSLPGSFYDFPYPSDLRLDATGHPVLSAFPNVKQLPVIEAFRGLAVERRGFPVVPVAYFAFSAAIPQRDGAELVDAAPAGPVLLVDIDAHSPDRGKLTPVVVATPHADDFAPANLLAAAPRPGFVLAPSTQYAFVVLRSLNDATGAPLGVPTALGQLAHGVAPVGTYGAAANKLYAPLWSMLASLGVKSTDVAAATVFTTGDVVSETNALSTALMAKYSVTLNGLHLDPAHAGNDRVCVLTGTVTQPQFQGGTAPFDTDGVFHLGADGLPVKQHDEIVPIFITIPKQPMPAAGYPLELYFHGSGGLSAAVIDQGPTLVVGGDPTPGEGPGWVIAPYGIAAAGSALPVNPERVPDAGETAYLNFNNLPCMRDNFRQGIIEQRLYLEALRTVTIDASVFNGCSGPTLPDGATAFHFDPDKVVAQGQSMGGMYTNLVSAVEPRIRAAVPTGAGGYWTYFILVTQLYPQPSLGDLVAVLLGVNPPLTFLHPALQLIETAWESADPFVSMSRLARRPLPGHPVRPIYEPVGLNDEYFPTVLYDAVALSYNHQEAGDIVWPTMQDALTLAGLDGIIPYPVSMNRRSQDGTQYTGAVMQYMGDGIEDPHQIYRQLDAVKYQYGCFLSTFLANGTAVIPAPAPLGTPCPQ